MTRTRDTKFRVWPMVVTGTASGLIIWALIIWTASSPSIWFLTGFIAFGVQWLFGTYCVFWTDVERKRVPDTEEQP